MSFASLTPGSSARYLGLLGATALAYFLAARFGLSLSFATRQVTAVWPPTGIAVAALVLFGIRLWPALFVGAFAANALANEPPLTALAIAAGNAAGPACAVWLLRRFTRFEGTFATTRDVFGLAFYGAALGMLLTASNGVLQLALGGLVRWSEFGSVWWVWWVGDAMGVLLLAPFLLTLAKPSGVPFDRRRGVELGLLVTTLLFACLAIFSAGIFSTEVANYHVQYAVFPFLIWAGLRFGPREAALAVLVVAGVAIQATIHDRGPFATGMLNQDERLVLLDMFLATAAVTAMTLAAVTAERRRAERGLRRVNDELEARVLSRTEELSRSNRELARKNEEIESFVYIVSHDLRGPLVNLQGFSRELGMSCGELATTLHGAALPPERETALRRILDQDIAGALRYISASANKFQRLIDALLALSRSGRQEYQQETVDVEGLVRGTLDSLRQLVDKSGASVTVERLPRAVGDVTALGQVFANLIVNALTYLEPARPGRIVIGAEVDGGRVHYFVKDNGRGIPGAAKNRVFQVFQRFHPELAAGEGLGLAIVKRVVERHGGSVSVESEEGAGTTFRVTLTLA